MPRTTAPSTNPRIISGYAPYSKYISTTTTKGSASTAEERRRLLLEDPHASNVQPEQITCTRCTKTVRLQKGKAYHLAHWLDHKWRCEKTNSVGPQPRAKCHSLLERKALLEADPDALIVEAGRVVCGKCEKHISFRRDRPYGLSHWLQHKGSCQPIGNLSCKPAVSGTSSAQTHHMGLSVTPTEPCCTAFTPESFKSADNSDYFHNRVHDSYRNFMPSMKPSPNSHTRGSAMANGIPHSDLALPLPKDSPTPILSLPFAKSGNAAHALRNTLMPRSPPSHGFSTTVAPYSNDATSANTTPEHTPVKTSHRAHIFPDTRHLPFPGRPVLDTPDTREYCSNSLALRSLTPPQSHRVNLPPFPEDTLHLLPQTQCWRFGDMISRKNSPSIAH